MENKKKVVIIGGVGNGTVIASVIEDIAKETGEYEVYGFLNDNEKMGSLINGYPVLGNITEEEVKNLNDCYFVYSLISVSKAEERIKKLLDLNIPNEKLCNIIHPSVVIGSFTNLGYGVVLMPNVVISPNVKIGNNVQIYANSLIGHNTTINDYSFIANQASVGSNVLIKEGVHIGSNSSILEKVTIGEGSIVGLGAVVLRNVPPKSKVAGNPARIISK
ncbi:NeuD/PglB/VioB family sugar acetyltransferase [Tissierella praeacuta]|uniref:NeuD/PglB/VioB family sugar acetyltransferase n=1 Tax=Tissierella praeacuta TaxID=43131 RepID=UPI002FD9B492